MLSQQSIVRHVLCQKCIEWYKESRLHGLKSYQMLHFNLIICKRAFDEIICIAYFTDKYTSHNEVSSLIDNKEKTLFSMFKSLINRCDRAELTINSMIKIITSDQKISVDIASDDWIMTQSIVWEWSRKYTLEQNKILKRQDALLIEKATCIRV